MLSREERNPLSDWWWTVDRPLLAAILALMLSGVVLSLAASPPVAVRIGLDPFHFFSHHVMFLLPSIVVMIGVSFMSPRQVRRSAMIVFAISVVLIVATLGLGPEVKGSRRWITLLGLNIQASESAKPAFVVLAAWLFAESTKRPEMPATSMALGLLLTLVALLVMEPDFGQTMLILMVWGALFFIAGMRMIWVMGLAGVASAGLFFAYLLVPHVAGRIKRSEGVQGVPVRGIGTFCSSVRYRIICSQLMGGGVRFSWHEVCSAVDDHVRSKRGCSSPVRVLHHSQHHVAATRSSRAHFDMRIRQRGVLLKD